MASESELDIQQYGSDVYYKQAFPAEELFAIFGQPNREFAFETGNIYRRFLSFPSLAEFKRGLASMKPDVIHVGAVYQTPSRDLETIAKNRPIIGKELVFDVDITSYNEYRDCCIGDANRGPAAQTRSLHAAKPPTNGVCTKCWGFCRAAMKILGYILRTMFGFKQIVYVFSGNKGFHVWVLDPKAFGMSLRERQEIATLIRNVDDFIDSKMVDVDIIYKEICEPLFSDLSSDFSKSFAALEKRCKMDTKAAILKFMWPRIDEAVTTSMNHLIKMPLSLHKTTKNITWIILEGSDLPVTSNCNVREMMNTQKDFYLRGHIPRTLDMKRVLSTSPILGAIKRRKLTGIKA